MSEPRKPTVDEVKNALAALKPGTLKSNRDWTLAVKQSLATLGSECGWSVCTSSLGVPFEAEWLYDQIWYSSPSGQLKDIGLIMECEWSQYIDNIQFDFEKLLIARSPFKVMVYEAGDSDKKSFSDRLCEGVAIYGHRDPAEVYILAGWLGSEQRFEFTILMKS